MSFYHDFWDFYHCELEGFGFCDRFVIAFRRKLHLPHLRHVISEKTVLDLLFSKETEQK